MTRTGHLRCKGENVKYMLFFLENIIQETTWKTVAEDNIILKRTLQE